MKRIMTLLGLSLFSSSLWAADTPQSDCPKPEVKALKSKKILDQITADAKVTAIDCTNVAVGKGGGKLLVIYTLTGENGVSSHFAVFNRGGLSPDAKPLFLSDSLGFDSQLMVAKGKKRMLFVMPGSPEGKLDVYAVIQTDANNVKFGKYQIDLHSKGMTADQEKSWKIDRFVQPKIYVEKGVWKAILKGKIVEL